MLATRAPSGWRSVLPPSDRTTGSHLRSDRLRQHSRESGRVRLNDPDSRPATCRRLTSWSRAGSPSPDTLPARGPSCCHLPASSKRCRGSSRGDVCDVTFPSRAKGPPASRRNRTRVLRSDACHRADLAMITRERRPPRGAAPGSRSSLSAMRVRMRIDRSSSGRIERRRASSLRPGSTS